MYFHSLPDQQELNWDRHKNQDFPDTTGLRFYKVHHPTPLHLLDFWLKIRCFSGEKWAIVRIMSGEGGRRG
jgi:hypothetical protein